MVESSSSTEVSFLSMGWIDESSPYHNNQYVYLNDKARWEAFTPLYAKWVAAVEAPVGALTNRGIAYLKYPTESYIDNVSFTDIGRPPAAGSLISSFENLLTEFRSKPPLSITEPDKIILAVDNSGSMHTSDIQPAYSNLVNHITINYPQIELVEVEWGNEDYINIWIQNLEEIIPPIDNPSSSSEPSSSSSESSSSDDCPETGPETLFFFNGQWHEIGLTEDQLDALYSANNPSASNPYVTVRDVDSSSSFSSSSESSESSSSESSSSESSDSSNISSSSSSPLKSSDSSDSSDSSSSSVLSTFGAMYELNNQTEYYEPFYTYVVNGYVVMFQAGGAGITSLSFTPDGYDTLIDNIPHIGYTFSNDSKFVYENDGDKVSSIEVSPSGILTRKYTTDSTFPTCDSSLAFKDYLIFGGVSPGVLSDHKMYIYVVDSSTGVITHGDDFTFSPSGGPGVAFYCAANDTLYVGERGINETIAVHGFTVSAAGALTLKGSITDDTTYADLFSMMRYDGKPYLADGKVVFSTSASYLIGANWYDVTEVDTIYGDPIGILPSANLLVTRGKSFQYDSSANTTELYYAGNLNDLRVADMDKGLIFGYSNYQLGRVYKIVTS
jgi:hypothetical protein